MLDLNYGAKSYIESKNEGDILSRIEMCDVCGKASLEIRRTSFPYKNRTSVTVRHHPYCDPKAYFLSVFGNLN